jgi:hypothetical protein
MGKQRSRRIVNLSNPNPTSDPRTLDFSGSDTHQPLYSQSSSSVRFAVETAIPLVSEEESPDRPLRFDFGSASAILRPSNIRQSASSNRDRLFMDASDDASSSQSKSDSSSPVTNGPTVRDTRDHFPEPSMTFGHLLG